MVRVLPVLPIHFTFSSQYTGNLRETRTLLFPVGVNDRYYCIHTHWRQVWSNEAGIISGAGNSLQNKNFQKKSPNFFKSPDGESFADFQQRHPFQHQLRQVPVSPDCSDLVRGNTEKCTEPGGLFRGQPASRFRDKLHTG